MSEITKPPIATKLKYVQVGLGARSIMFQEAILDHYPQNHEMLAVCDNNEGRVRLCQTWANEKGYSVKGFLASDFDSMIKDCLPDIVIVTTKDKFHDEYICRAMELGCDVITEKPMTTTAEKCQRIIDTIKKTGRSLRVTFNYRYAPPRTQIKELLMSGIIGDVLSVDFHWLLDTHHGADYFRRWHRNKDNSGGLLVHKATHHFDLVNWWLSSVPETVFASGRRGFYTPQQADVYGLTDRAERCLGCTAAVRCPFYLDLRKHDELNKLYLQNEQYDDYYRDRCVFSENIDIEDSMELVVGYRNGVKMSYSLNAFMPWEGYAISFNGTRGRLEHHCEETVYISGDGSVQGALKAHGTTTSIYPHFAPAYQVDLWQGEGGHGGGDYFLLRDLFADSQQADKYMRAADHRSGAYSILTGIAANRSIQTGQLIRISDLITGLELPDYPPMPDRFCKHI